MPDLKESLSFYGTLGHTGRVQKLLIVNHRLGTAKVTGPLLDYMQDTSTIQLLWSGKETLYFLSTYLQDDLSGLEQIYVVSRSSYEVANLLHFFLTQCPDLITCQVVSNYIGELELLNLLHGSLHPKSPTFQKLLVNARLPSDQLSNFNNVEVGPLETAEGVLTYYDFAQKEPSQWQPNIKFTPHKATNFFDAMSDSSSDFSDSSSDSFEPAMLLRHYHPRDQDIRVIPDNNFKAPLAVALSEVAQHQRQTMAQIHLSMPESLSSSNSSISSTTSSSLSSLSEAPSDLSSDSESSLDSSSDSESSYSSSDSESSYSSSDSSSYTSSWDASSITSFHSDYPNQFDSSEDSSISSIDSQTLFDETSSGEFVLKCIKHVKCKDDVVRLLHVLPIMYSNIVLHIPAKLTEAGTVIADFIRNTPTLRKIFFRTPKYTSFVYIKTIVDAINSRGDDVLIEGGRLVHYMLRHNHPCRDLNQVYQLHRSPAQFPEDDVDQPLFASFMQDLDIQHLRITHDLKRPISIFPLLSHITKLSLERLKTEPYPGFELGLKALTSLNTLILSHCQNHLLPLQYITSTLDKLKISQSHSDTQMTIADFPSNTQMAIPNLSSVGFNLQRLEIISTSPFVVECLPACPSLTQLKLKLKMQYAEVVKDPIEQLAFQLLDLTRLVDLKLYANYCGSQPELFQALKHLTGLTKLNLSWKESSSPLWEFLNLTNLKCLEIACMEMPASPEQASAFVDHILTNQTLTSLTLTCHRFNTKLSATLAEFLTHNTNYTTFAVPLARHSVAPILQFNTILTQMGTKNVMVDRGIIQFLRQNKIRSKTLQSFCEIDLLESEFYSKFLPSDQPGESNMLN